MNCFLRCADSFFILLFGLLDFWLFGYFANFSAIIVRWLFVYHCFFRLLLAGHINSLVGLLFSFTYCLDSCLMRVVGWTFCVGPIVEEGV